MGTGDGRSYRGDSKSQSLGGASLASQGEASEARWGGGAGDPPGQPHSIEGGRYSKLWQVSNRGVTKTDLSF